MSNKKSLGSSPIGLKSNENPMSFISDLGESKKNSRATKVQSSGKRKMEKRLRKSSAEREIKKKTVSYYLDTRLIAKVKSIAGNNDLCYSALVSKVLQRSLSEYESI